MEKAILFIIPTLETGGAQTFLVRLATHLSREVPVHVYVIHPGSADNANEEKLAAAGIRTVYHRPSAKLLQRLGRQGRNALRQWITRIDSRLGVLAAWDRLHLNGLIRSKKIALVNSHMYLSDSYCCRMLEKNPVPIVTTLHGCYNLITEEIARGEHTPSYVAEFEADTKKIASRLSGIIYLTDRQISAVPALRDASIPKKKIYNGFMTANPQREEPATPEKKIWHFGMVARGIAAKGWEELINAYQQVKEKHPDLQFRLSLVGDGDILRELKKRSNDPTIAFPGRVADPLPLMQDWDVGLLPTYFDAESLPNSVIEYLYSGIPVVATDVAEIPNMIGDKTTTAGFIVPLSKTGKPEPEAIADALRQYIENPALWAKHRHNTALAYNKFDIHTCVADYRAFFRQVNPSAV